MFRDEVVFFFHRVEMIWRRDNDVDMKSNNKHTAIAIAYAIMIWVNEEPTIHLHSLVYGARVNSGS